MSKASNSPLSPLPSPLSTLHSPLSTDIVAELSWRGLINQTTDDANLPRLLLEKPRTVYVGFDPTADSLHVGHLVALMVLRRFQKAGHRPIAVVGGATGMIGDPSGKSEERNLLSIETLRANVAGMASQLQRFLDFDAGPNAAVLVNNYDWMSRFSYLDFLRDVGKHFPVNVMLAKDSVRSRLERDDGGMSYTEFSYMLLQAYDFVHLNEEYGCEVQAGGSDQWGNITAGIDLARRLRGVQLYGCTCPLLTKSDGTKMGKTESGALWLSAEKTSPYKFYQYWINLEDAEVGRCLRFFTDMGKEEIEALLAQHERDPGQRAAQRRLAADLTLLVHGDEGLRTAALRATEIFFGAEISDLSDAQLTNIFADVPSRQLPREKLAGDGLPIIDALVEAGLAKSKGDARRSVTQGGAYVNNRRVEGIETRLTSSDLAGQSTLILRSGKKNYALLRFV
jgi:tyrosyl-tRNA synthetase